MSWEWTDDLDNGPVTPEAQRLAREWYESRRKDGPVDLAATHGIGPELWDALANVEINWEDE